MTEPDGALTSLGHYSITPKNIDPVAIVPGLNFLACHILYDSLNLSGHLFPHL